MYLLSLLLFPGSIDFSSGPFGILSPDYRSLILLGDCGTISVDRLGRWWTVVSAMYLHGSLIHILFNMIAFRQLSGIIIREFGTYRMIVIYTLSGIASFTVSYSAGVQSAIGASGAICGLLGAGVYFGWSRGGVYGNTLFRDLGVWAIALLIIGFVVPNVGYWGHGGGFAAGAILGFLLNYQNRAPESLSHKYMAGVCMVATLATLGWAVGSGVYHRFVV
jgi:rhomboid protease GluP